VNHEAGDCGYGSQRGDEEQISFGVHGVSIFLQFM
jgi:hypothetical protein